MIEKQMPIISLPINIFFGLGEFSGQLSKLMFHKHNHICFKLPTFIYLWQFYFEKYFLYIL